MSLFDQHDKYERMLTALQQRLSMYDHILSSVGINISILDEEFCYQEVNQVFLDFYGNKKEEVVGKSIKDFLGEDLFRETIKAKLDCCLRGELVRFQQWFDFPLPGRRYMDVFYCPLFGVDDQVNAIVAFCADITTFMAANEGLSQATLSQKPFYDTEIKKQHALIDIIGCQKILSQFDDLIRQLHDSKRFYSSLASILPVGVVRSDCLGNCTYANQLWCDIAGITLQQAKGINWLEAIHPDDRQGVKDGWQKCVAGGLPLSAEYRFLRGDGSSVWVLGQVIRESAESGKKAAYVGTINEISQQKSIAEDLAESERRHRRLYNETPIMMHSIDTDGRLIDVNNCWLKTLGYKRPEVIGRLSSDFLTEESKLYAQQTVLPAFFSCGYVKNIEYQMQKNDGSVIDVLLSADSEIENGVMVRSFAVIKDISEQKRIENELHIQKARLEESYNSLNIILDRNNDLAKTIEERTYANIKDLIESTVEGLRSTLKEPQQIEWLNILTSKLENLSSGYAAVLRGKYADLTPKERQIADLILAGKSTKEIASYFNLSNKTIEFHRNNLRKKLGIDNSKTSLRSFLAEIASH